MLHGGHIVGYFNSATGNHGFLATPKEAFHVIQPARARRRKVHVIPRVASKPVGDLRHSVGPVVVHDDVHVAVRRQGGVDLLQKCEQLLMPMATIAAADDFPSRDIQRREQRGGDRPTV